MNNKVKLLSLVINNYRNISQFSINFAQRTSIEGKNELGKTNVIEAIHWLLTDSLLNGSGDKNMEIIPKNDYKSTVRVEAHFQVEGSELPFVIIKRYKNTILKGGDRVTGHSTEYEIGNEGYTSVYSKIAEAKDAIQLGLGFDPKEIFPYNPTIKYYPIKAAINPKYYTEILPQEYLKELVKMLVGVVSTDEVFEKSPETLAIKDLLKVYKYDDNEASKYVRGKITEAKQNIKILDGNIEEDRKVIDPNLVDVIQAQDSIEIINKSIYDLQNQKKVEDPRIETITATVQSLRLKASKILDASKQNNIEINAKNQANKDDLTRQIGDKYTEKDKVNASIASHSNLISSKERILATYKYDLQTLSKKREDLLAEYHKLKASKFAYSGEKIICPKCGTTVNEEFIQKLEKDFNDKLVQDLAENYKEGNDTKLAIANTNLKISAIEDEISSLKDEDIFDKQLAKVNSELTILKNKLNEIQLVPFVEPHEYKDIKAKIMELDKQLEDIKNQSLLNTNALKLDELEASKAPYQEILDKHVVFLNTQEHIKDLERRRELVSNTQIDFEQKFILLKRYMKTYSDLLTARAKVVFPDVDIQLIEMNLTDGSWSPVCYPLVTTKEGNKVRYSSGSGYGRIRCSLMLQKDINNAIGLPIMPLLIDEAESIDNMSKINVENQLIVTRVNDNYETPKIIVIDLDTNSEVIR